MPAAARRVNAHAWRQDRNVTGAATQVPEVYVVSDGTGDTAGAAVTASMVQFQVEWRLRTFSGIRHESEVRRVVGQAAQNGALLVFTLVDKRIAGVLVEQAIEHGVPVVDLLGPLIARAADHLRAEPRADACHTK